MPEPPLEIERKYLLSGLPPVAAESPFVEIHQGYLPGEVLIERLRLVRDDTGEKRYRTVKAGTGISRVELEEEVSPELFNAMWPFTEGRRVSKRRYLVRDVNNAVTWEVDSFTDRDLVLAEVELEHETHDPALPAWLAPYVIREVSGESAYLNLELAKQGAAGDTW